MFTRCDNCDTKLKVPDTLIGKKAKCPKCGAVFRVVTAAQDSPLPAPELPNLLEKEPLQDSVSSSGPNNAAASQDAAPSEAKSFEAFFFRDLETVHEKLFETIDPRACLHSLVSRFEKRRTYLQEFCANLAHIVESTDQSPKRFLPMLARRFGQWRTESECKIELFLKTLPNDDPLKCAVSLFGTMDFGRLERAHTKVLAWFLDPCNEEHEFSSVLLKSLLRLLESDLIEHIDFASVSAKAEKWLDTGERLDIFVEGKFRDGAGLQKKWYLVIEAKVDAVESPEQAGTYDDWIDLKLAPSPVIRVFLTPDRRAPASTEAPEAWKRLSFMDLAIEFRKELVHLQGKAGYHFLRHYLTGIFKDIYRWKLPIRDPKQCVDPYGFLAYVTAVPN